MKDRFTVQRFETKKPRCYVASMASAPVANEGPVLTNNSSPLMAKDGFSSVNCVHFGNRMYPLDSIKRINSE